MALTNAFYEAVQTGNVSRVRIMMADSLLVDPSFEEFNAMEKAASSLSSLYDEHSGDDFIEDRSRWDDNYMDKLMVDVSYNFSRKRIEHLKEVVRYLRPVSATSQKQATSSNAMGVPNRTQGGRPNQPGASNFNGVKVGAGAVAGGAVGGAVSAIAGASGAVIVGGILVGALVGGVAAHVLTKP